MILFEEFSLQLPSDSERFQREERFRRNIFETKAGYKVSDGSRFFYFDYRGEVDQRDSITISARILILFQSGCQSGRSNCTSG